jgi:hypothetical protein
MSKSPRSSTSHTSQNATSQNATAERERSRDASPERDPLGAFEHGVLALFEGALSTVAFPGVDRGALGEAARTTLEAQIVVEAAERDLEQARRELAERATELTKLARRAVAYARVLAEDDDALGEKLDALAPRVSEPTKAPRKRRARADEPMLPTMTSEEPEEAVEDQGLAAE